jgi:hypothetical protein
LFHFTPSNTKSTNISTKSTNISTGTKHDLGHKWVCAKLKCSRVQQEFVVLAYSGNCNNNKEAEGNDDDDDDDGVPWTRRSLQQPRRPTTNQETINNNQPISLVLGPDGVPGQNIIT